MPQMPQICPTPTPDEIHIWWLNYGECKLCHQDIRHELHLYNHWRRYHTKPLTKELPHYYYWHTGLHIWIETSQVLYQYYKDVYHLPTARTK